MPSGVLESMTREDLIRYIEILSKNFLTIDGYWFLGVEEKFGIEAAIDIDRRAWEQYAVSEAKRIKELLGIAEGTLADLERALQLICFAPSSGVRIELLDGRLVMTITKCRPQRARTRDGRGEFACKPVGFAHLSTFAKTINPRFETRCIFAPPDSHPDGLWCRWEFSLKEDAEAGGRNA